MRVFSAFLFLPPTSSHTPYYTEELYRLYVSSPNANQIYCYPYASILLSLNILASHFTALPSMFVFHAFFKLSTFSTYNFLCKPRHSLTILSSSPKFICNIYTCLLRFGLLTPFSALKRTCFFFIYQNFSSRIIGVFCYSAVIECTRMINFNFCHSVAYCNIPFGLLHYISNQKCKKNTYMLRVGLSPLFSVGIRP